MKPHVACRSRELEKHLLELWRAEAGATLLSVAGIAVNVLIVEWSEVKVAYVANEVGGAAHCGRDTAGSRLRTLGTHQPRS
jgi:hypothetical protein